MGVPTENGAEEGTAGREDNFMSADLIVLAGQRHVTEVLVILQLEDATANVGLKVIPLQTKFLGGHGAISLSFIYLYISEIYIIYYL